MPRIRYEAPKKFRADTLEIIALADEIATDYKRQGYNLTLRQLYYQFISRDFFANTEKNYKRLGRIISDARLQGLIDWNHLVDRGREAGRAGWHDMELPSIAELVGDLADGVAHDLWEGQARRIEVWVEKEALEEVASKATGNFRMGYFACKGYVSQSAMWGAAQRLLSYNRGLHPHPRSTLILHLGDHDPSGIDMTRDIRERLTMFGAEVEVKRIALNMDQIEEWAPPPNFAKENDPRFADYESLFGSESWELDSLDVATLDDLIQTEVRAVLDIDLFNEKIREEEEQRDAVREVSDRWDEIEEWLEANPR